MTYCVLPLRLAVLVVPDSNSSPYFCVILLYVPKFAVFFNTNLTPILEVVN